MKITGGLAIICTFNVGGSFSYDGPCGAANVYLCTQAAGAQAKHALTNDRAPCRFLLLGRSYGSIGAL